MTVLGGLAALSLAIWIGLLLFRGGFWRASERLDDEIEDRSEWPGVVAVIPARNEAGSIAATVRSLFAQDYPGRLAVIVVDDASDDGTGGIATEAAEEHLDFRLVEGEPLPDGWTGKVWAQAQGIRKADETLPDADYLLLTDADILHDPANLKRLVAKAEAGGLVLTSLMVKLRCRSFWEQLLIPAFVFFFQKLYPFPQVNDPGHGLAAAAGGCMLVRREALRRSGGIEGIRRELIDDCALARQLKTVGPIWLGLATATESLRAYDRLGEIWRMVARTAFVQLRHSPLLLAATILSMLLLYAVPVVASLWGMFAGVPAVAIPGVAAWTVMTSCYRPTLMLYGLPTGWAVSLPVAGLLYTVFTVDSARRHWLGRGGDWKGRVHAG